MLQIIDGREVFVVEINGFPRSLLPVTWESPAERPYAIALDSAIKAGIVTAPGKYGIHVTTDKANNDTYNIYKIIE